MDEPERMNLNCFKAYDIRGKVPEELNEELAWRIGRAYADEIQPGAVVVGPPAARDAVRDMVAHKIRNVLGCSGKA